MSQCVSSRAKADNQNVLTVIGKGIRAFRIQWIPSRQKRINLEAKRHLQHIDQDAGFRLWNVHGLLFLENARLHTVVADPMSRAWTHWIVDHHKRQRCDRIAALFQHMHL